MGYKLLETIIPKDEENTPVTYAKYIDYEGQRLDSFLENVGTDIPQYTLSEYLEIKDTLEEGTAFIITDDASEGIIDYNNLENQPQINSVSLAGNLSAEDLNIQPVIPRYTLEQYEMIKDTIPANTLFIITDDEEE